MTAKTYTGGCHCGKVRYQVTTELGQLVACNCSICSKRGWLLAFADEGAFELVSGEDALTDYQFNKHVLHHLFCGTCGVASFGHGKKPSGEKAYSINVRCLDDVDVDALAVHHYDGKSL